MQGMQVLESKLSCLSYTCINSVGSLSGLSADVLQDTAPHWHQRQAQWHADPAVWRSRLSGLRCGCTEGGGEGSRCTIGQWKKRSRGEGFCQHLALIFKGSCAWNSYKRCSHIPLHVHAAARSFVKQACSLYSSWLCRWASCSCRRLFLHCGPCLQHACNHKPGSS